MITIENTSLLSEKKRLFWQKKIERFVSKFDDISYFHASISKPNPRNGIKKLVVTVGIPGNDVIVSTQGPSYAGILTAGLRSARAVMRRRKERRVSLRRARARQSRA